MFLRTPRSIVLLTGETCLLSTAVIASAFLVLGPLAPQALSDGVGILRVALIVGVCQMCLHYADLYELPRIHDVRGFFVRLVLAVAATALILALVYLWFPRWTMGPSVILIAAGLVLSLVPSWRLMFAWLTTHAPARQRLLFVGVTPAANELARTLASRHDELGIEIAGFAEATSDLPTLIEEIGADRVIVSLSDARGKLPMDQLLDLRTRTGVTFVSLESAYERYTGKIALEALRPSWFVFLPGLSGQRPLLLVKRVIDIALAFAGLVLSTPILLTAAVLVRLTSSGGALYRQQRVGKNGREFTIYKLRTMRADAEAGTGPAWSALNDPRITPVGAFLRKTRVDEVPQLWNVLRGDMSLVGPRPERPEFVTPLTGTIPYFAQRHVLRPGITGWAQIRHAYAASVEDSVEKLQYDLYYLKNLSLWFDLLILVETVKTVVRQRGAR